MRNNAEPHETLVGDSDLQAGGLADDRSIRAERLGNLDSPQSPVFFVCDPCEDHVSHERNLLVYDPLEAGDHRSQRTLHVACTSAVKVSIRIDARSERIPEYSLNADRVQMAVQHEGGS